ncbi:T9SS type A sorting domain-containing protein, partial [Candidatus Poribacteria bacterium]|nr:T9SS type A sorting domain-containing protein [Candidatus Poribacteria bacterium]
VDLWSTIPNYLKEATAYSFDMPSSALAAPYLMAERTDRIHPNNEYTAYATMNRAPSTAKSAFSTHRFQYTMEDYNSLINDVYGYIQNNQKEKVQEKLETLVEYSNYLMGDINVNTAQILAASPNALNRIPDYDAMYSKFENDLSKATSERINLYTSLASYLADPDDPSIKDLVLLQIGTTRDTNNELEETITSTNLALNEASIYIPNLVIVKNFSTPDIIPRGEPFIVNALIENIGQQEANGINITLSVPKASGLVILEKSIKYFDVLKPDEEWIASWELEYTGSLSGVENGVNLVTISVGSESESPDFGFLPPTYILIPSPPPTPPTGGKLSNMNVYAYPNPFNPDIGNVNIRYSLNRDTNVTIEVYDISGDLVTTLIEGEPKYQAIEYAESWDGKNDNGDIVANGVYFYLITTTTNEKAAGKIAVLR